MKKMFLMLAIMALATGAFAAWTTGAVESFLINPDVTTDTTGTITPTDDATIYARFRVLGPAFKVVVTGLGDTWQVTNFLPGDYGWQTTPFDITNIGGMALDLGTRASDATPATISNVTGTYSEGWAGSPNTYRMWAVIVGHEAAAPTMVATAGNATAINNLNFTSTAAGWYDADADGASYMVPPAASKYWHAENGKLNLWAVNNIETGTVDNAADLYLGMQSPFAGWSHTGTKTIPITVYGRITSH